MDSQKLKIILIAILTAFFALYLGMAAATAQVEAITWVVGVLGLVLLLAMGRHLWALVPLGLAFSGGISFLPGGPPVWWFATLAAGGMMVVRFLSRSQDFFIRFNALDLAILLQVIAVGQAWVRNPAGFSMFGGDTAGGRPYVAFAVAVVAYLLMSFVRTDMKTVRTIVLLTIMISIGDALLQLASQLVPALAAFVMPFYSGVSFDAAERGAEIDAMTERVNAGKEVGYALGFAMVSLYPPLTTVNPLYIFRFSGMCLAVAAIMFSGFRSAFGMLLMYFLTSLWLRRQYHQMVISAILCGMALFCLLISGTTVRALPMSAQRILSVIPFVQVEDRIRSGAHESSDWRFEMWKLALTTDRYIRNKLLGDGFGVSATEMRAQMDAVMGDKRRMQGVTLQETMLERGSFHGFHVETIRCTGVLGLILALVGMGIFLRYALVLIRHFKGHPYWGYVIFICLPYLITPFYYMLIFGSYRFGFIQFLAMAGMLKVLDNIRVRELAEARAQAAAPAAEPALAPVRSLPPGRLPQPAMRSR